MSDIGWTKEEYDKAPEVIGRLHARILDLEDAIDSLLTDDTEEDYLPADVRSRLVYLHNGGDRVPKVIE